MLLEGTTMNDSDSPKPKRRWYQFRMRTLLVFVTLCAVACGWFVAKMQRARKQEEAIKAIREAGGYIQYRYGWFATGSAKERNRQPGPAWMVKLLGFDFFAKARGAHVPNDRGWSI